MKIKVFCRFLGGNLGLRRQLGHFPIFPVHPIPLWMGKWTGAVLVSVLVFSEASPGKNILNSSTGNLCKSFSFEWSNPPHLLPTSWVSITHWWCCALAPTAEAIVPQQEIWVSPSSEFREGKFSGPTDNARGNYGQKQLGLMNREKHKESNG